MEEKCVAKHGGLPIQAVVQAVMEFMDKHMACFPINAFSTSVHFFFFAFFPLSLALLSLVSFLVRELCVL